MLPATAKEAREIGSPRYFTGKPCKHGHVAPRWTATCSCWECQRCQQFDYDRTEQRRRKQREYSAKVEQRPTRIAYNKKWLAENNARLCANYRAQKVRATPPWLTDEHLATIRAVYAEAARLTEATGIAHHVDHIIPLIHEGVCGWHTPWNLQVLTAENNRRKSNSFDGTMENEGWR